MADVTPQWIDTFYERAVHGGWQRLYRFDNGYGASVVDAPGNYSGDGTWEVAILYWHGTDADDWRIVYDTPIASDVMGWQTDGEVEGILRAVRALPERRKEIERG